MTGSGQPVTYAATVTNTGNVTVHAVGVASTFTAASAGDGTLPLSCATSSLAPGASTSCSANYPSAAADLSGWPNHQQRDGIRNQPGRYHCVGGCLADQRHGARFGPALARRAKSRHGQLPGAGERDLRVTDRQ